MKFESNLKFLFKISLTAFMIFFNVSCGVKGPPLPPEEGEISQSSIKRDENTGNISERDSEKKSTLSKKEKKSGKKKK